MTTIPHVTLCPEWFSEQKNRTLSIRTNPTQPVAGETVKSWMSNIVNLVISRNP